MRVRLNRNAPLLALSVARKKSLKSKLHCGNVTRRMKNLRVELETTKHQPETLSSTSENLGRHDNDITGSSSFGQLLDERIFGTVEHTCVVFSLRNEKMSRMDHKPEKNQKPTGCEKCLSLPEE